MRVGRYVAMVFGEFSQVAQAVKTGTPWRASREEAGQRWVSGTARRGGIDDVHYLSELPKLPELPEQI